MLISYHTKVQLSAIDSPLNSFFATFSKIRFCTIELGSQKSIVQSTLEIWLVQTIQNMCQGQFGIMQGLIFHNPCIMGIVKLACTVPEMMLPHTYSSPTQHLWVITQSFAASDCLIILHTTWWFFECGCGLHFTQDIGPLQLVLWCRRMLQHKFPVRPVLYNSRSKTRMDSLDYKGWFMHQTMIPHILNTGMLVENGYSILLREFLILR